MQTQASEHNEDRRNVNISQTSTVLLR